MTADQFRRLALGLPEAIESAHGNHPDFRVGGKVFASLGYPDDGWGMVRLTPPQQAEFVQAASAVFTPAKGAWGARGATCVRLRSATKALLLPALVAAWKNLAPRALTEEPASRPTKAKRRR